MKKVLVILVFCLSSCSMINPQEPNLIYLQIIDKYYNNGTEWLTSGKFTLYEIVNAKPNSSVINGDVLKQVYTKSVNDIYASLSEREIHNLQVGKSYKFLVTSSSTRKPQPNETRGEYRLMNYQGGKVNIKIVVE